MQTSYAYAIGRLVRACLLALVLLAVLGTARPAQAILTLTSQGTALGFSLSTFASNFPTSNGIGPAGIAFPSMGGVLVADFAGNVRLFPTDTDGQNALSVPIGQSYGQDEAFGLAQFGNNIYMTQGNSKDVVQINSDGTFDQTIVSGLMYATAIVANPANGHLFVDYGGSGPDIVEVDPVAKTVTPFVTGLQIDGLAVSPDGKTLYGAVYGGTSSGHIFGFNISTGAQVYDSGFIAGNPDGIAVGYGNLAGNLFVNTNAGTVVEVNLNLTTGNQTVIADSGGRGDFATADPNNGTLLLTQTSRIFRLIPPPGGSFVPVLSSLSFLTPVPGGTVLNGTVTLSGIAASDVVVGLSSSDSSVIRIHRAVIVPAGSSSAMFEIDTYRSHVTKTVTLQATLAAVVLTKDLTITGR